MMSSLISFPRDRWRNMQNHVVFSVVLLLIMEIIGPPVQCASIVTSTKIDVPKYDRKDSFNIAQHLVDHPSSSQILHSKIFNEYKSDRNSMPANIRLKHSERLNSIYPLNFQDQNTRFKIKQKQLDLDRIYEINRRHRTHGKHHHGLVKQKTSPVSRSESSDSIIDNFVHKRTKRDQRLPRKIKSKMSPMPFQMPSYYPYVMAEMTPGGVKIRPDRNGRCRQVFQYTVKFGDHNTPNNQQFNQFSNYNHPARDRFRYLGRRLPSIRPSNPPIHRKYQPYSTKSPRLLALLRKTAEKFDLSFLNKNSSSSSGESSSDGDFENLRKKILKVLKLKNKDDSNNDDNSSYKSYDSDKTVPTPDYDD